MCTAWAYNSGSVRSLVVVAGALTAPHPLAPPPGMRVLDPGYKLQKNIKIAMLYLEDDDRWAGGLGAGAGGLRERGC